MSRHTAAIIAALPKTEPVTVRTAAPANDAASEQSIGPVPQYTVSTALSSKLRAEALTLAVSTLKPVPRKLDDYLLWVESTQGRAWKDQHILAKVAVDGRAVTVAEINSLGEHIEWVRQVIADDRTASTAASDAKKLTTPQLASRIDANQRVVHNGLMHVLHSDPEARANLSKAGRQRSKASRSARSSLLLSYVATPANESALRALPGGEGASIDALKALHPEWAARLKNDSNERKSDEVSFVARAVAMLQPTLQRVLRAGRYVEKSMPGHEGTYPGFRPPKTRKPKAAPVSKPVTP